MSHHTPLRRANLAAEIRAEMARQRVSINQLAAGTSISASTLYRRLNGVKPFNVDELDAIAVFLGVPAWELAERAKKAAA
jgi:transcriptional regulator with XRE-family HTH domain